MEKDNQDSLVLSSTAARQMLGNPSRGVFYGAIRRGVIPSIRLGPRKIIIPKQRFLRWLDGGGADELRPEK